MLLKTWRTSSPGHCYGSVTPHWWELEETASLRAADLLARGLGEHASPVAYWRLRPGDLKLEFLFQKREREKSRCVVNRVGSVHAKQTMCPLHSLRDHCTRVRLAWGNRDFLHSLVGSPLTPRRQGCALLLICSLRQGAALEGHGRSSQEARARLCLQLFNTKFTVGGEWSCLERED